MHGRHHDIARPPRGVKLGRKPKLTPHQQQGARRRKQNGEAIRDIARTYNVHNSTISRLTALQA
jgi:DNA invertase Pin-like site-specific DNA recombinase